MKLSIIHDEKRKCLKVEPTSIAEAFELGEVWGQWQEKINVGWGGDGNLIFDLKPMEPEHGVDGD